MKTDKFYVTTPIYYVNAEPHIGHAYTTILADVLARYHRMMGVPSFFLTGTDEHGQKVKQAAEKTGVTPQQHADATVVRFHELWKKLEITNDDFIRTTEARHKTVVQAILQDLYNKGEIYKSEYDGWYCVPCERFFTDRDLEGEVCPECTRGVERIRESNYFFRMSAYQEWLVSYIRGHPRFIQPDFRRNETLGFLRKKLNDLCISRPKSRLSWGIELPFDRDFVTYVWFDALVNYISAIGYLHDDAAFRKWWPASYHLIGKDILTTHTVYWPTMLKAMNLPMPETVFAHGWWLVEGSKMAKSVGNVVNPVDLVDEYGADAFRYYVMTEMIPGQDASFSEGAFIRRYNADLANDLGNLLSRVRKLMDSGCDGRIPEPAALGPEEEKLKAVTLEAVECVEKAVDDMKLESGFGAVTAVLREANRYLERRQPWSMAKQTDKTELKTVLYCAAECLRIVAGLLQPIMPGKMGELRAVLGLDETPPSMADLRKWGGLKPGAKMGAARSLFPRIEAAMASSAKVSVEPLANVVVIEYADFQKVQLRTARVLSAERVEGADKLLCLQIDLGGEKCQIVAGIALHYTPEALVGRNIVVVANLKPARIRGIESKGMLLAASSGKNLRLVTIDGDLPPGSQVK